MKVRVLSYDVRRRHDLPASPNGRFQIYIGTGGPGHLDPRLNDGTNVYSQGVTENHAWEAPLFNLFDDILTDRTAAMIARLPLLRPGLPLVGRGRARAARREEQRHAAEPLVARGDATSMV